MRAGGNCIQHILIGHKSGIVGLSYLLPHVSGWVSVFSQWTIYAYSAFFDHLAGGE
jgi:hypothetical protein